MKQDEHLAFFFFLYISDCCRGQQKKLFIYAFEGTSNILFIQWENSKSIYYPLSSRQVNYVQKSAGHPLWGGSLSGQSSDKAVGSSLTTYKTKIKYREGGVNNVKSVESSVTKVALCVCVQVSVCVSVRVPVSQGSSICVHVVFHGSGGSSQRGRRLRFGRGFLVSELIEEHVGCFCLQKENMDRVTYKNRHSTPRTES